jgi:hypothetical protein
MPACVDSLVRLIAADELAIQLLRASFRYRADDAQAERDIVRDVLRDRLCETLAAESASLNARIESLSRAPVELGAVLAVALIVHNVAQGDLGRSRHAIQLFATHLASNPYPRAEGHGDGQRLYWAIAAVLAKTDDPLSEWTGLIAAVPRDFEGWRRRDSRAREVEIGHYCVLGAMASEWLMGLSHEDIARALLKRVDVALCEWIRAPAALDRGAAAWALTQTWARVPLCLGDEAVALGLDRVDDFDNVEYLVSSYSNLDLNLKDGLPAPLRAAVYRRYQLMREVWRAHDSDENLEKWFETLRLEDPDAG